MHNFHYDDMFFASIYITGLKEEICGTVEASLPNIVDRVTPRYNRRFWTEVTTTWTLWRDRKLKDYMKANGLCFNCGEKFDLGHLEVYSKRTKP